MTSCPALNTFTNQNPTLITVQNQKELRLSNYDRAQGTSVELSCASPFKLYGQSKVTCQTDGSWDFTTKPCCDEKDCIGVNDQGLTEQTKILIAVLVSVAAVAIIILCCIVCLISSKIKKKKRDQRKLYRDDSNSNLGYMLDERAFFPPPYHWHPMAYPFESHRKRVDTPVQKKRSSLALYGGSSLRGQNQYSRSMYLDKTEETRTSEQLKPIGWDDDKSQQTQRKTSDDTSRNQPLAILPSEELYGGKIYRSPARSIDSDRVRISQYKPRSVDYDYQKRTSEPEIIRSEEYRINTVEPEFRRRTAESELVRSDPYRISTVEPEFRRRAAESELVRSDAYQISTVEPAFRRRTAESELVRSDAYPISTVEPEFRRRTAESELVRSDAYRISTVEPEYRNSDYFRIVPDSARPDTFRIVRVGEPVKTEQIIETPAERQLVRTRNSFVDNEWNKPLDNVYVSNTKIVQTTSTSAPPPPPPSRPERPKKQFQGHWPARSEMKEMKEFNRRALLNGRDPFLWSNVNSNFGFHLEYDK